jgi:xylose dehydrogenase (NAD/NADP)
MNKVKWGVLGCAAFARNRAIPSMLKAPSVELVGVASRSWEKAERFRGDFGLKCAYGSYEEMLSDPQIRAVYIPLPNGLHAEWTIRAAEAGKHVLCEKPFTSNANEAEQVATAAARSGVKVMEAFMWRFHPQHERARKAIENGVIGPLRLIRGAFSFMMSRQPNVRWSPDLAGGSVMDVGCYPISASRFYYQAEPITAFALGQIDPEFGVDIRMGGVLQFPQGLAFIDSSFQLASRGDLEIAGEKGRIYIPKAWLPDEEASLYINGQEEKLPPVDQYTNQFEHFSQCILQDIPPRYGPEDAILQMKVVDAVLRSMRSGQVETV